MLIPLAVATAQVPPAEVEAELFRTAIDAGRTLWTDDAARPADGLVWAGASTSYAHRPLIYTAPDGTRTNVVAGALRTDLVGAVGWQRLRAGLVVPVSWTASSDAVDGSGTGLGDLAFDGKLVLVDPGAGPAGLAVTGRLQAPTATVDLPLGSPGLAGELAVVGQVTAGPLTLLGNLGPRLAPRAELEDAVLNDALSWRLGASVPAGPVWVAAEGMGRLGFGAPFAAASPVELLASVGASLPAGLTVRGGAAAGLGGAVGVPAFRAVAAVTFQRPFTAAATPAPVTEDLDLDGLGPDDQCPSSPEDRDGHADTDGCPDADDDADGVVDGLDLCREEPEDLDGWRDDDGCPDPKTRVGVAVADASGARWPAVAVNVVCGTFTRALSADQSFEVEPGSCTFGGGGSGGIPAFTKTVEVAGGAPVEVAIPLEPTGPTGVVTVTVTATDGGAVEQAAWSFDGGKALRVSGSARAKLPPGRHAVRVFAQGFADHEAEVEVKDGGEAALPVALAPLPAWLNRGRISTARPLTFAAGTATLDIDSAPTVAAIAALLAEHPEVTSVAIEVSTDPSLGADRSQLLSDERALVIRDVLVNAGVAPARLTLRGWGASRPLPSATERVDLLTTTAP